MKMRRNPMVIFVVALVMLAGFRVGPGVASTAVVPDDYATVQGAIDSGADTVLVREGSYPETPVVNRKLQLIGIGGGQRPRLNGLALNNGLGFTYAFGASEIAFAGLVRYTLVTSRRNATFNFSNCSLENGFYFFATDDPDYITLLAFRNCRVSGDIQASASHVLMVADTVDNAGVSSNSEHRIEILDCRFLGGPGSAIAMVRRPFEGIAARNVISNYSRGISGVVDGCLAEDNQITNCDIGIDLVASSSVTVRNNLIQDCRLGINLEGGGDFVSISGNTVLRADESGILLGGRTMVEGNVVGYCGDRGISFEIEASSRVRRNTVFRNGGPGLEIRNLDSGSVENNISFGNNGWGLVVPAGAPVTLRCNDWFQNQLGAVSGTSQGATDLNVDPIFCNVDSADVRLSSNSPLIDAPSCGQIGALGVGCGATATLLEMFSVDPHPSGAIVRWRFAGSGPELQWLERGTTEAGPWHRLSGDGRVLDGMTTQTDPNVDAGQTYWYRIGWSDGRDIGYSSSVRFTSSMSGEMTRVLPNPSNGPVSIEWTLPATVDTDVRIYDLAGREVASLARGRFQPGSYSVSWDGVQSNGGRAPTGCYLVKLRMADRTSTHRLFLLR